MKVIIIMALLLLFFLSPFVRCICLNPFKSVYYLVKDIFKYVKYKRWNEYKGYGALTIFNGLFGRGKTLSSTIYGRRIYDKWNGRKIYDFDERKWKTQRICLVSNVEIKDKPYIPLRSLTDIITLSEYKDDEDTFTIWLVLVDEMSTQVNSREYKTNFSTELLNVMLTCRHYRMQMIGSAQRFNHVDALIRQITSNAVECFKIWRVVEWTIYDAWTIENTADITKIKPRKRQTVFVTDKDFNAYDTTATVENFKDNVRQGNFLTDKEILDYQQNQNDYSASKLNYKRRYRKKI